MATTKPLVIVCACGKNVRENSMEKHLKTNFHEYATRIRTTDIENNKKLYEYNKKINNCCSNCYKINIPNQYYLADKGLCICCSEVLKGGEKLCILCNQNIKVELMERPYLHYCKKCAAARAKKPRICECGATICLSNKTKHEKTKKHKAALENITNLKVV